jgi:hypothetical protein
MLYTSIGIQNQRAESVAFDRHHYLGAWRGGEEATCRFCGWEARLDEDGEMVGEVFERDCPANECEHPQTRTSIIQATQECYIRCAVCGATLEESDVSRSYYMETAQRDDVKRSP